jgi:hypothetical protein
MPTLWATKATPQIVAVKSNIRAFFSFIVCFSFFIQAFQPFVRPVWQNGPDGM